VRSLSVKQVSEKDKFEKEKKTLLLMYWWSTSIIVMIEIAVVSYVVLLAIVVLSIHLIVNSGVSDIYLSYSLIAMVGLLGITLLNALTFAIYKKTRHVSGKKLTLAYLQVLDKVREGKEAGVPVKERVRLFNTKSGFSFAKSSFNNILSDKLNSQEWAVVYEFRKNFDKFIEITQTCDSKTYRSIFQNLEITVSSLYRLQDEPGDFLKNYFELKRVYNDMPEYLKQFEKSRLYDVNRRYNIAEWIMSSLVREIFIIIVLGILAVVLRFLLPSF
jgi:hypothetical protein